MTTVGEARTLASTLLRQAGLAEQPARRSAELLVLADVWGIGSHGLMRLPHYLDRLAAGGLDPAAELTVVRDGGAVVAYDGNDGLSHWQLWEAAESAAERAAQYGVAIASVGSSSHCGSLGIYTLPGIRRGLVSLVFSTGPAVMAAPGTASPLLSTSPLAAGIPCRPRPAICDLATSAVARGKIADHAKRGAPIPDGWAVDSAGLPTTDPRIALTGLLAPMAAGKGFALAFMVEALTGATVGPMLAGDIPDMFDESRNAAPQRIGHLVISFDPGVVAVDGAAEARLDELAARVQRTGGRIPGASRALPWDLDDDLPVQVAPAIFDDLTNRRERRSTP